MSVIDQFRLDDTVALVTGAGRGIGESICHALAEAGARVVCLDLDADLAESTAASLDPEGVAVTADVADADQVREAFSAAEQQLGPVDAVYANAGIPGDLSPFYEADVESWQQVIDVNLTGVFLTARQAARHMIDNDVEGTIISTASIYGFVGSLNGTSPAYTAAKAGVRNLTQDMAVAGAEHGIRVNAIAPGFVATEMVEEGLSQLGPEEREQYEEAVRETTLLGRMAEREELQGIAVFLASDASRYMTGATVPVDGGFLSR